MKKNNVESAVYNRLLKVKDTEELRNLCLNNKDANKICKTEEFWKKKYNNDLPFYDSIPSTVKQRLSEYDKIQFAFTVAKKLDRFMTRSVTAIKQEAICGIHIDLTSEQIRKFPVLFHKLIKRSFSEDIVKNAISYSIDYAMTTSKNIKLDVIVTVKNGTWKIDSSVQDYELRIIELSRLLYGTYEIKVYPEVYCRNKGKIAMID